MDTKLIYYWLVWQLLHAFVFLLLYTLLYVLENVGMHLKKRYKCFEPNYCKSRSWHREPAFQKPMEIEYNWLPAYE